MHKALPILFVFVAGGCGEESTPATGAEGEGEGEGAAEGEGEPVTECVPEVVLDPALCEVELACPGGPGCETGTGELQAGFSKVDITPPFEVPVPDMYDNGRWLGLRFDPETWLDCGRDQLCPDDDGYEAPDADGSEGDEVFQAAWLAGFGNQRPAEGVHDPIWARCAVFSAGDTRVALVSFDIVGLFFSELERMRERLDPALGIDLLVFSSTHVHEAPDTMGQWGPDDGGGLPAATGRDEVMQEGVRAGAVRCVEEAVAALRPAEVFSTMIRTGVDGLNADTRDPVIIDDELPVLRVDDAANGDVLGTIVDWGSHPETLSDENTQITSDFPHWVRQTLEEGTEPRGDHPGADGLGGVCIYFSGAVGGLTTTLRVTAKDPRDGAEVRQASFDKARIIGERLGLLALEALGQAELETEPALSFASRSFLLPVRNRIFHVVMFADFDPPIFDRQVYNFAKGKPVTEEHVPWVLSEVAIIRLGGITFFTVPGEVFPETVVGFDDTWSHDLERIDAGNDNPPDLTAAPDSTPLKRAMPGDVVFLLGLGNDELGYMVPPYDYELGTPEFFDEADGDHYEETNSIGRDYLPIVERHLRELAAGMAGE